jgi:hypothetical protein
MDLGKGLCRRAGIERDEAVSSSITRWTSLASGAHTVNWTPSGSTATPGDEKADAISSCFIMSFPRRRAVVHEEADLHGFLLIGVSITIGDLFAMRMTD